MTTAFAQPEARKRRRKTRTRTVNSLPPIVASSLKINEIDLTLGKEHLVCPDCERWTPITGILGTPKLVPHHTKRCGTVAPRRCNPGSNRQVTIDISTEAWRTNLVEAAPTTASRRATKVLPKPKNTTVPAPVHKLAATREQQVTPAGAKLVALLDQARRAIPAHRAMCAKCGTGGRCEMGRELEFWLLQIEATAVISREQQAFRDGQSVAEQRAARQGEARTRQRQFRQVRPSADRAARERHDIPRPAARSKRTLVDDHELVRRTASWPAPTHGGPGLPLNHPHI